MLTFVEKIQGSILLIGFLTLFTLSTLFFYVEYSPVATTGFYNFTETPFSVQNSYLVPNATTFRVDGEVISLTIANRFADEVKASAQDAILFFSPWSRHFGHKDERVLLRKYNTQVLHIDLPGFGGSSKSYSPSAIVPLLKKLNLDSVSIFGQGLGSNFALDVAATLEKSKVNVNHVVLFSPWSIPNYNEDWENLASGHRFLKSFFSRFSIFADYIIKIASQFGFITRAEYWYSNLNYFLGKDSSDLPLLQSEGYQPIMNNSFVQTFHQGVGPLLDLYTYNMKVTRVSSIKSPISIFHSKNDITSPFSHSERIQKFNSHAKIDAVDGSGHFTLFDQKFESAIRDVLKIKEIPLEQRPHIIVVGGGLAGLSAAIEAESYGATVTLLEKEDRVNGNSAKASSGINGALTNPQKMANITDSYELFYNETIASGKGFAVANLVDVLVKDSSDAIAFFERRGINMDVLSMLGGHSVARTHRPRTEGAARPRNAGADIMSNLYESVKNSDGVKIITKATVTKLIKDDKKIVGVEYDHDGKHLSLHGEGVILATGGYSADRQGFLKQHFSARSHIPTSNGPFATGDGIRMGEEVGAGLKHMNFVQIHPSCYLDPKDLNATSGSLILAAEALRGYGAILVNSNGARFCNEVGLRDDTSEAIFKHCSSAVDGGPVRAFMIMNDFIVDKFGRNLFAFYEKVRGLIVKYDNFDEMAAKENIPVKKLKRSITNYSLYKSAGKDPFKKTSFPTEFKWDEPIYVAYITPCIHYSMGGLNFDPDARVLSSKNKPIPGLYAAGEVTGGVHGKNRLGGNSLLECVVFGRRAGRNAVENRYVSHLKL